jgi:hypothetical protein
VKEGDVMIDISLAAKGMSSSVPVGAQQQMLPYPGTFYRFGPPPPLLPLVALWRPFKSDAPGCHILAMPGALFLEKLKRGGDLCINFHFGGK